MLSFEVKKSAPGEAPEELDIFLDLEGLKSLMAQLELLKEGRTDHIHLMSQSWGGSHLS